MIDSALHALADAAGLSTHWIDFRGHHHAVAAEVLTAMLGALEIPCATAAEAGAALAQLEAERRVARLPPMLVAPAAAPLLLPPVAGALHYRITFEDGTLIDGLASREPDGRLRLPAPGRIGYHRLEIGGQSCTLAATPPRCFGIDDAMPGQRPWGLTAQLYSLRRRGDGGIGDFTALAEFARSAARHGAHALAVSPVHALFAADVQRYSPYSPSSRLFVNASHADPAQTFGAIAVSEALAATGHAAARAALEALPLIDWPAAARAKLDVARHLYAQFATLSADLQQAFAAYCEAAGNALRDHARFEALHAHFLNAEPPRWHWRDWPAALRDSESVEVARFAAEHADKVRFHAFLQWLADRGLHAAQTAALDAGMRIGLIGDLAVGTDGGGSHAWSRRHDLLIGAGIGAPPDPLNALGQSWGLTAFSPRALRRQGYAPFIEMLRAQLRHVGGLRIDHVLGLGRLWLVPDGAQATEGAYLRYPIEDLFGLIALESWRSRAVIIGEDMGTVPEGFRPRMAAAGILGMRVLWFERDWGLFVEPARWPDGAVALTSTHDLPTVAGWWAGRDIDWRARLNLYGVGDTEAQDRAARAEDRGRLWAAFCHAGVADSPSPAIDNTAAVADAACAFVAATPAPLVLIPAEDVLGVTEQPNVPGTIDEHPNWRRRLPGEAATLLDEAAVAARLEAVAKRRSS